MDPDLYIIKTKQERQTLLKPITMKDLKEVDRYINSFPRPVGLNHYAWRSVKRLALHAWECYLNGRRFTHNVNFLCKEFYLMIRTPEGNSIIPESRYIVDPSL